MRTWLISMIIGFLIAVVILLTAGAGTNALLTGLTFYLVIMLVLGAAFWVGRRVARGAPAGPLATAMLWVSATLTALSVIDLIGAGILFIWPSTLLLGFFWGWTSRHRQAGAV